jgi:nickel/cobalt transporter (NicO) family protein
MLRRVLALLAVVVGVIVVTPAIASAHPLGNFTVNTYAGLRVAPARVSVDYVVDMAEIPTLQRRPDVDRNGDGTVQPAESSAYRSAECARMAKGLHVSVDQAPVGLTVGATRLSFPPGQAGLATMRLECRLGAPIDARSGAHQLAVNNTNYTGRIGWHELTAVGDGATLARSPIPTATISARLTKYPADRLESPLDHRRATVQFSPGGKAAPAIAVPQTVTGSVVRGFDDWTASFTGSVAARRLTLGLALVALAIGMGLGALHAFAPGHGKTVMAAYLVGERGSARHGLAIGLTVAVTHTLGVLALGLALTASQAFAPESVYPWLGVASGVTFVALGFTLLWRALQRRRGIVTSTFLSHSHGPGHHHDHGHSHDHGHDHGPGQDHDHDHDHGHSHTDGDRPRDAMSWKDLSTLGIAGGMIPTPTAVVVLLGATAIGRAWFGVLLVVSYGVGMAITLVAAGLLLSWARNRFEMKARGERMLRFAAAIPIATAVVVTVSGLWLVAKAAVSAA